MALTRHGVIPIDHPDPVQIVNELWDGMSGGLLFDVGANQGQTIRHAAPRFERIVAVEPSVECIPTLEDMKCLYGGQLAVEYAAATAEPGTVDLVAADYKVNTGQLMDSHSFEMGDKGAWHMRQVKAVTLDELAAKYGFPDAVKIDVEGHEAEVLAGAPRVIEHGPRWLIEIHSEDLHARCVEWLDGYTIREVRHPAYPEGSDRWLAHLWIRAEKEQR